MTIQNNTERSDKLYSKEINVQNRFHSLKLITLLIHDMMINRISLTDYDIDHPITAFVSQKRVKCSVS
jgi:hypothetical protein